MPMIFWLTAASPAGFALSTVLVARPLRNSGKYTVTEFLTERFDSYYIKIAVPVIFIIGLSIYLMAQMKAGGLIASYITGLPYEWGLVITCLVFIFYVSTGGMLAVTWTNLLQGGMMLLLTCVITVAGVLYLDQGVVASLQEVTKANMQLGSVGAVLPVVACIGSFVSWVSAPSIMPHLVMRIFTSKDVYSGRLSLNIGMLFYGLMMFASVFAILPHVPSLGAEVLSSTAPDMWMLLIMSKFFGPFLVGVFTAGIMAAVMSTTDAILLACSASFAYDIYGKVINKKASQKQLLRAATISTWVIGIVVMLLSLNPHPFLIMLYTAAIGLISSSLLAPMILGIWWKRANTIGASVSMTVGAVLFMYLYIALNMPYTTEILVALPVAFLTMTLVSLFTSPPPPEVAQRMEKYHVDAV